MARASTSGGPQIRAGAVAAHHPCRSFLLGATAAGALANGVRGASRGAMVALGFAAVGAMAALAIALLAYGLAARCSARPRRC